MSAGDVVALVAATAWTVAVALSGKVGVWLGVGGAAVLLGGAVLVTSPDVRAQLRPDRSRVLLGLATGLCMVAATYLFAPLVQRAAVIEHDLERLYSAFRVVGTRTAALALAPIIVGEELVWRGAVQNALEQRLRPRAAALVAATLYAAAHAPMGSLLLVVTALGCGLVWSSLRAATGSLVPSLISHALWDAVVLLALPIVPA